MSCSCTSPFTPRANSARRSITVTFGAAALASLAAWSSFSHGDPVVASAHAIQPGDHAAHATAALFACPMKCEGAKAYHEHGKCPVCRMALKRVAGGTYSAAVTLVPDPEKPDDGVIAAGKLVTLRLAINNSAGAPVTNVETVHEKPLHLLIVSKDLSFFAHEHPAPEEDGTFTVSFAFPAGGDYTLYHDFTPAGGAQQIALVPVKAEGIPAAAVKLAVDDNAPKVIDGYTVTLGTGGTVKTGAAATLGFTLSQGTTPITTLAPYLGAMGHLVVLSEDGREFVHSHPVGDHEGHAATSGGPTVAFEAHFKVPGLYKAWGQFNVGTKDKERIITAPFVFEVAKGDGPAHEHGEAKVKSGGAGHNHGDKHGHDHK